MKSTGRLLVVVATVVVLAWAALRMGPLGGEGRGRDEARAALRASEPPSWVLVTSRPPEVRTTLEAAAARAWSYIEAHYQAGTGLVGTVPNYPVATLWDIASTIAAYHAARDLGLLDAAGYDSRMGRLLATLESMPLFEGIAFNKAYDTRTARMVDREGRASATGYGWSALDLGRLLAWLRIVAAREPRFAPAAERIVDRLDLDAIVARGWLVGGERLRGGTQRFQEGRLGYEQYAARGFALWGAEAVHALDWTRSTRPVAIDGVTLLEDVRPNGCLTAEPFALEGLELGWDDDGFRLAGGLLAAQRARTDRTGIPTMTGEDASDSPPHYFYYYCVLLDGEAYAVAAHGQRRAPEGPRTISTKMAFAWYALTPNVYTRRVVDAVAPAALDTGWAAGLHETDRSPAGPTNVNTAAVILEAALFAAHGRPLLRLARDMHATDEHGTTQRNDRHSDGRR